MRDGVESEEVGERITGQKSGNHHQSPRKKEARALNTPIEDPLDLFLFPRPIR